MSGHLMKFKFVEFNSRRAQRGAEAARVEVIYSCGMTELLWMSRSDIAKNLRIFQGDPELQRAQEAYRTGK